ncbi:MAG: outer membrane beta-barrel protein [Bacteroidota bacterium]
MKKFTLVFCVLCAQFALAQKTFIGLKAGGHTGSAYIDHTIFNIVNNNGLKGGPHGGLIIKYFPQKRETFLKSGVQFSVNYARKGWTQIFLTNEATYSAEMSYIEIPVEAIGFFGKKNNYFITAGFFFEHLFDYQLTPDPDLTNLGGQDFHTYRPSRDQEVGYGARASAGIFRNFSFGMVHLEGFFTYSISNFIDPGDLTTDTPDLSNLWYTGISIGYLLPVGKKE